MGHRRVWFVLLATAVVLSAVIGMVRVATGAPAGRLDRTWSGDGIRIDSFAQFDEVSDVIVSPDGRVYVAGWGNNSIYLARYRRNGSLDDRFGVAGRRVLDLGSNVFTTGLARQSDGKFVVVADYGHGTQTVVARFTSGGAIDGSFGGGDGWLLEDMQATDDNPKDVLVLPDGDLLLVGHANSAISLMRLNPNGGTDGGFGTGGKLVLDPSGGNDAGFALARQGQDILIAGRVASTPAVMRVDGSGVLDPTFGDAGIRTIPVIDGDMLDVERRGDGRLVALGGSPDGFYGTSVGLLTAAGDLVSAFAGDGVYGPDDFIMRTYQLAHQPRKRVILAGAAAGTTEEEWRTVRLTSRGTLDRTYSGDGRHSLTSLEPEARLFGVASQPDGKFVAVGTSGPGGFTGRHATLVRYEGDIWTRALRVAKRSNSLRVTGMQFPVATGQRIVVKLFRRNGGRFRLLDGNVARLQRPRDPDGDGFKERPFVTAFERPSSGRCRIIATAKMGAGYGTSKATKTFGC